MNTIPSPQEEEANTGSSYWYIWNGTKPVGPIFYTRLKQMAHKGELSAETQVRMGTTGDWITPGSISDFEFPDAARAEPESAEPTQIPESDAEPSSGILWIIREYLDGMLQGFSDLWGGIRRFVSWVVFAVVFIALGVVLSRQFSMNWLFWSNPIATYATIWEELKQKRNAQASPEEWEVFATRARRETASIVARLERTASPQTPMDQQLLWAGRDYLPKMLTDARTEESAAERKFAEHLQRAQWLKQGLNLYGFRHRRLPISAWGIPSDSLIVLGIIFVVVDVWAIAWFARKWLKGKSHSKT